jgi:phage protein U
MMYAQLGNIRFVRPNYFMGVEGTKGFGFAEHPHVQGKPSLQAVGDPLDTKTLDMRFERSWCDPRAVYEKFVAEAAKKQAMALTWGDGTYEGKFVVRELAETVRKTGTDGTLHFLDVRVTLTEYVDEEPIASAKREQIANAPARKPTGKPTKPAGAKKGKPGFTVAKATNKDGVSFSKIVRQS